MNHTHYVSGTMHGTWLRRFGADAARYIIDTKPHYNPILLYTGMSGTSLATAVAIELDRLEQNSYQAYVRKDTEESHSWRQIERTYGDDWAKAEAIPRQFYFIDDFVDSGKTLTFCVNRLKKTFPNVVITPNNLHLVLYKTDSDIPEDFDFDYTKCPVHYFT